MSVAFWGMLCSKSLVNVQSVKQITLLNKTSEQVPSAIFTQCVNENWQVLFSKAFVLLSTEFSLETSILSKNFKNVILWDVRQQQVKN